MSNNMFAGALPLANWLGATSLSRSIQTAGWIIPALQTIHILCVAVLFSSALLAGLRLLGVFERELPLTSVMRRFLPAIWPVLLILLTTGTLLIVAEPKRSLLNSTFYLKMALLAFAILLTAGIQRSLSIDPNFWDKNNLRQAAGWFAAALSILIWTGIIFAGRWIAYTAV
jgi:hypothetical protein